LTSNSIGLFGPDSERLQDLRLNPQLPVLDPSYEGDFFDPDEIEICLRSYGVTIPPRKEFVTAYLDLAMFEKVENTGPAGHQNHDSNIPMGSLYSDMSSDIYRGNNFAAFEEPAAASHYTRGQMGTAAPAVSESLPRREYWQKPLASRTKVTVDIERLITGKSYHLEAWSTCAN
jgi:hypothetical protein